MNDGTFWIEWRDFQEQYNQVFLCYDFPDSWGGKLFLGAWDPSSETSSHGGCPKHPTFAKNPQFGFKIAAKTSLVVVRDEPLEYPAPHRPSLARMLSLSMRLPQPSPTRDLQLCALHEI